MRTTPGICFVALSLVLAGGCQQPQQTKPAAEPKPLAQTDKAQQPVAAAHAGHGSAGHECSPEVPASQAAAPRLNLRGGDSLAVGQKLAGLPPVTVAQLVKQPAAFAGKSVRIEGKISTLCHHRRGWFAVKDPAAPEGPAVRIITAPTFLVPENAVGRTGRAEGQVEVIEVSAETASYFAKSHGIGTPEAYKHPAPVKQVIIRAVGAEFI